MDKYRFLLVCFALLCACNGGGSGGDAGNNNPTSVAWVDNSLTQPVPVWGSAVRLSLPVPVGNILLGPVGGIGGFGSHQGGHVEGLDHVWIETTLDSTVKSWGSGTVTAIEDMGDAGGGQHEYFITINYGQGLIGKHMEVATSLVSVGSVVKEGDPVAIGLPFGNMRSAEFMLADLNRRDGVRYGNGSCVSPFDYLKVADKQALIDSFMAQVVAPYFNSGKSAGNNKPWEPGLTNKVLFHSEHRGTIVGEWILANKGWTTPDPLYFDVLTVLDVANTYGHFQRFDTLDDDMAKTGYKANVGGNWSLAGPGHIQFSGEGGKTYYGLYSVDESGGRAKLTMEWQEGGYPAAITVNAAVYLERAPLYRRGDAQQIGIMK